MEDKRQAQEVAATRQRQHRARKRELEEIRRLQQQTASTDMQVVEHSSSSDSDMSDGIYAGFSSESNDNSCQQESQSEHFISDTELQQDTRMEEAQDDVPIMQQTPVQVDEPQTDSDSSIQSENLADSQDEVTVKDATWFANQLCKIGVQCDVSDQAIDKVCKLFLNNLPVIQGLHTRKEITSNYRHGIRTRSKFNIPKIRCALKVKEKGQTAEQAVYIDGLTGIPSKYLQQKRGQRYVILRQDAYTTLTDIKAHYKRCHPGLTQEELQKNMSEASLSIDGVRETKHGSRTLIVITLMFDGCLMLWKILNPLKKTAGAKPNIEELLRPLVEELNADGEIKLKWVVADMVERHHIKGLQGHMSRESCEFCECRAKGGKGGVDWQYPNATKHNRRTNQRYRMFASRVRDGRYKKKHGIIAYSPLMDLHQDFDIIMDIPLEEFHLLKEGLTKLMFKRIIQGESSEAKAIRGRLDAQYEYLRVFSELPRRSRNMDSIGHFKGSEFGLLLLTVAPYFLEECLNHKDEYWRDVAKCMAAYTFISRAYYHNDDVLGEVEKVVDLPKLHQLFYRLYQKVFCQKFKKKVSPNAHAFWHLYAVRKRCGPLYNYSTEAFEAFYSKCHRGFRAGTRNTPLQIMKNVYTCDSIEHRCRHKAKMTLKPDNNSAVVCDAYITTKTGAWEILKINNQDSFLCRRMVLKDHNTKLKLEQARLPWHLVGVKRLERFDDLDVTMIERKDITGKIMLCGDYAMEWKKEWFRDSKVEY